MKEKKKLSFIVPDTNNSDDFIVTSNINNELVNKIDIDKIKPFPNHPFSVLDNNEMEKLVESIKDHGVQEPIMVRSKDDFYELLSGHRRTRAAALAGYSEIPAIVKIMTDDEATIYMVDANLHRENILPSEKAKAYKMKMDALRHQGKKNSSPYDTVSQSEPWSANQIAQSSNESSRQVYRYIRLANLTNRFLEMIDNKELKVKPEPADMIFTMPMNVGLVIAGLAQENQNMLFDCICSIGKVPSLGQANKLLQFQKDGTLTAGTVSSILNERPLSATNTKIKNPCDTVSQSLAAVPDELIQLHNKQERENFITNYKKWGVWKEIPELNLKFYQYKFPTGTQFIVTTYEIVGNKFYNSDYIREIYRLILSPTDTYTDKYGEYGYYDPKGNGKSPLIDYLTKTKSKVLFF